ncbi:MAG: D-alanyl-D-alanine carboxypeptidase [Firmicutes bacterium]|nr:D-alanyl-D-alanine carboxypeptidase [Bacillota bacterium]
MKLNAKQLTNFISSIVITALLLTGAVPSFTWAADTDEAQPAAAAAQEQPLQIQPSVDISAVKAPKTFGTSVLAMDMRTGTVLYEKNADEVRQPASVTKILTCLVILENLPMDEVVTVPEGIEMGGSSMGLMPGEKLTVEELLYGLMLPSGNDAAEVLAIAAGGSIDGFGEMMNARAKEMGAVHTDFRNPNGLNEDPQRLNYTTARDLAIMSREAMKNPDFRKIVGTAKHTVPATNLSEERDLENSNWCLWKKSKMVINKKEVPYKYDGCTGIKTGFTSDAGNCFVGSAERDGTEILVVSLNSEKLSQRYKDGVILWNDAFSKYETSQILQAGESLGISRVRRGETKTVEVGTKEDLYLTVPKGTKADGEFTTEFQLKEDRLTAPVEAGQSVGDALVFNSKGQLVGREELYTLAAVGQGGPLSYIGIADKDAPMVLGAAGALLLLIIILTILRRSRSRKSRRKQQDEIRGELATMRTAGVGMTIAELSEVTGKEEIKPIDRGPARISDEELTAWTSTVSASKAGPQAGRFGGRSERGGYGRDFPGGAQQAEGQPAGRGRSSLTDEELFALLEQTNRVDRNRPRRHAGLTRDEMIEVMRSPDHEAAEDRKPEQDNV